jgi:hypothetical protein
VEIRLHYEIPVSTKKLENNVTFKTELQAFLANQAYSSIGKYLFYWFYGTQKVDIGH